MYPNLEAELKRRSLKRSDVANAIGINISTASGKLSGSRMMTIKEAKRLRDNLLPEFTLDYLFDTKATQKGEMNERHSDFQES